MLSSVRLHVGGPSVQQKNFYAIRNGTFSVETAFAEFGLRTRTGGTAAAM
jgi:hypothetical protein